MKHGTMAINLFGFVMIVLCIKSFLFWYV